MQHESRNIEALIEGCIRGSRKAQELLYKSYYAATMSICLRYTKNEQDAVEVLNNAFLKVFKNIQRYEPGQASFYTWVRTIVVNSCLDFIRSRQRMVATEELVSEAEEGTIEPEAISKMNAAELLQLIRQLPPATQAVFNLFVIEGFSHKEIGALLNISEGTSKWHLSEGRKCLQQWVRTQRMHYHE